LKTPVHEHSDLKTVVPVEAQNWQETRRLAWRSILANCSEILELAD
jgi:hypothetical protein